MELKQIVRIHVNCIKRAEINSTKQKPRYKFEQLLNEASSLFHVTTKKSSVICDGVEKKKKKKNLSYNEKSLMQVVNSSIFIIKLKLV